MTITDLRRVLKLVDPYKASEHCLAASHDEITVHLSTVPPIEVTSRLRAITGVALSWASDDVEWDGETIEVTCFT